MTRSILLPIGTAGEAKTAASQIDHVEKEILSRLRNTDINILRIVGKTDPT